MRVFRYGSMLVVDYRMPIQGRRQRIARRCRLKRFGATNAELHMMRRRRRASPRVARC